MNVNQKIIIYTDGAASGNPGPGGYGAVLMYGRHRKEISKAFRLTTNNRMELMAVIEALKCLKKPNQIVVVYTDSKYVSEAVNQNWVFEWEKKNFKNKKNPDLWKAFLCQYRNHQVQLEWVKGHSDNVYNNRCDQLAVEAYKSGIFFIDEAYESLLEK